MIIKNAEIVLSDRIISGDLKIKNGKIIKISENIVIEKETVVYDAAGKYLLSGFIDTHTHGAMGDYYSNDNCDVEKITEFEAAQGVTTVTATLLSMNFEKMLGHIRHLLPFLEGKTKGARLYGIHSEGPFLNPLKKGGMNSRSFIPAKISDFDKLYEESRGHLKIITLAPEKEGAIEVISHAVSRGVNVSAGHTEATYEQVLAAIDAGLSRMTHTFNACAPFNHREPGILGAVLTDKRITCEVICDFFHLHPATVELIYKLKSKSGFCAVSDSVFGAGMPEGKSIFADGLVRIISDGVVLLENGTITGSTMTMRHGFKNLNSLNIPLWEISEMMSLNPARSLKIDDLTGSIQVGKNADLVIIDENLDVYMTFVDGECVYNSVDGECVYK